MKNKGINYYITRLIVFILVFMAGWIGITEITQSIIVDKLGVRSAVTDFILNKKESGVPEWVEYNPKVSVAWYLMYRFNDMSMEDILNAKLEQAENKSEKTSAEKSKEKYDKIFKEINSFAESIPDKVIFADYINMAGSLYNSMLGWEIPAKNGSNNIVSLENGYYSSVLGKYDPTKFVNNICEFRDFLKEENIPLLYVAAPRKITENDFVSGVVDFSVQNVNQLTEKLSENNINYIKMIDYISEEYEDPHEAFFKTDIHWKPQTALFVSNVISEYLNDNFDFDIDLTLFDPENFEYELYENRLLGSEGRKLTTAVADPEDFYLLYQKDEMTFTLDIFDRNIEKTGGFEIFYNYAHVLGNIDYNNKQAYEAYMHGNNAVDIITNHDNSDGKKVLMLGDSYSRTVAPFMAVGISQLELLDLRSFNGSLESYIEINGPYDAVVILYNPGAIAESNLTNFK